MTFKIGMKVVCVNASFPPSRTVLGPMRHVMELVEGHVYTISAVGLRHPLDATQGECVLVEEVERGWSEPFWASRFRPAVSPKQEVSFTTGADPDSERFDNRRTREKAWGCSA